MKTTRWLPLALAALFTPSTPLCAQGRPETIDEARAAFEDSTALRLLMPVANPTTAGTDSLWAVSVHELALRLIESGDAEGASLWLHWAARHGGRWRIDRSAFPPRLIEAYDRAFDETRDAAEMDSAAETAWRWPSTLDRGAPGTLEIASAVGDVPVTVAVRGRGSIAAGGSMELSPGTYEIVATAQGYEPVTIQREVLPGVATTLRFDLPPALAPSIAQRIASSLVSIRSVRAGQTVCSNGFLGPNGLILTSLSALPGAIGLEVATGTRVYADVPVLARDAERDVAWLRVGDVGAGPAAATRPPTAPVYAWSTYRDGCGAPALARVRVANPLSDASFAPPFRGDARGAPLIDGTGAVLGMVVAADRFLPIGLVEPLVDQRNPPQASRGGFPIKWVGAGVAAAAAGVAAYLIGAGGSGDGGESPGPTTGDIVVTLPPG